MTKLFSFGKQEIMLNIATGFLLKTENIYNVH